MRACVARLCHRHLAAATSTWRGVASRQIDLRARLESLSAVREGRQRGRLLRHWHTSAGRWAANQRVVRRAVCVMRASEAARAFTCWAAAAAQCARHRAILGAAAGKLRNRSLASAFSGWHSAVVYHYWQRGSMAAVVKRLSHLKAAAAFGAWRSHLSSRQDKQLRLAKAVACLTHAAQVTETQLLVPAACPAPMSNLGAGPFRHGQGVS